MKFMAATFATTSCWHSSHCLSTVNTLLPPLCPRHSSIQLRAQAARRHHRRRYSEWRQGPEHGHNAAAKPLSGKEEMKKERQEDVVVTLDFQDVGSKAAAALASATHAMRRTAERGVLLGKGFANEGKNLFTDLRSSVSVQDGTRLVISVRRSSLEFAAHLIVCSLLVAALWKIVATAFGKYAWRSSYWSQPGRELVRRDRSLGGKEVLVGKKMNWVPKTVAQTARKPANPLDGVDITRSEKKLVKQRGTQHAQKSPAQLPGWWPDLETFLPPQILSSDNLIREKEIPALMSAIIQRRLSGQDFEESDVMQLRRLCKCSGSKVRFDTLNTRDSFYRAAIDFVLSSCCRREVESAPAVYAGEKAANFIVGLAADIDIDAERAATMVNAAVAARTRSSFLQAWAFIMQGRNAEAKEELLKLGRIHAIFPPERNSPEMEMVAQGLAKHLSLEERRHLFQMYLEENGTPSCISEALDVVTSAERG